MVGWSPAEPSLRVPVRRMNLPQHLTESPPNVFIGALVMVSSVVSSVEPPIEA